ncbi:SAC3/GANP/Nin1/mts3/eIF-3 p25 family-domain-containing protein [Massariosphaeria phaeospora]|uniref:SAC3/GANP/Nin1/mts3/eIF-3 p25 family-domain-containing protein n=1 Tax=Massariosphaeria phaeospora TaxID=100035 RepID=A0A7C8ILR2_9PLEO|nr:SAC3/GANP/Nin1/mts3/eIF-3 p25 family-domain-containing protein [Massariosphaeria phaeospora]
MTLPTTVAMSRAMQQPAYTAVTPRTTLMRPAAAPAVRLPKPFRLMFSVLRHNAAAPAAKPTKVVWSDPVRDYVGRAFDPEFAIEGISHQDTQEKLKSVIGYYASMAMQDEIDWATYPLPQQIIAQERNAAQASSPSLDGFSSLHQPNGFTNPASASKKRKSTDVAGFQDHAAHAPIPPWRHTNLQDRVTLATKHNDKRQKKHLGETVSKLEELELEKRKQRFQLETVDRTTPPPDDDSHSDMLSGPIVGTNQKLEKSFFRLTAPPDPATVRPQDVLERTLAHLTKKWKAEKNYNHICMQFKSLRQDLTVQHIKNAFTVRVYERHARIALEKGDLGEYNQCQTQLKELYEQNLGGNPVEFTAYRILYFVYTCNKTDMNDLLAELTPTDKSQEWIKHALAVRSALTLGNYHKFFKLYLVAKNMGGYLMDMFIERERLYALANFSHAYMSVALRFLTDELAFESDDACREFLESHGVAQYIVEDSVDDQLELRVKVKEARRVFEQLRAAAFSIVDIKGQI